MRTSTDIQPEASLTAVRGVRCGDAPAIAELLAALGYPSAVTDIERRIMGCVDSTGTAVFVAESNGSVTGVVSVHCIPMFHAEGALGRITSLIVVPDFRRQGIGRLLVAAAEEFACTHGCIRVEVTSGDHRPEAHAFYERLGYQRDCRRFIKSTQPPMNCGAAMCG